MYRNKHLTRCDLLLDVTVSSFSIFDDVKQNKKIKKKKPTNKSFPTGCFQKVLIIISNPEQF